MGDVMPEGGAGHPGDAEAVRPRPRRWYATLYIQVLIGIACGILLGHFAPATARSCKWLGDIFIDLIKMTIAPIIFCTLVHGIAGMGNMRKTGRTGLHALIYFEVVSTAALAIGVLAAEIIRPGAGFGVDVSTLDASAVSKYVRAASQESIVSHIMAIVPTSFLSPLVGGDLLQVLLVSILSGLAIVSLGEKAAPARAAIEIMGGIMTWIIGVIVKLAPLGAFGAIAFTVGQYGVGKLGSLAWLIGTFYATSLIFVLVVLGGIARLVGFSIFRYLSFIKDEVLIVFGSSSSETVLPRMMSKMEALGASRSVVGLVIPTGYSFNLDGTNIYMTLTTLFLAQVVGAHLSLEQYAMILGLTMLTSKGAAGVSGAGFVTLAATLSALPNSPIPVAALTIVLGIDKFMSECRSVTNVIGNGVATLAVAAWHGELDRDKMREALAGREAATLAPAETLAS